MSQKVSPQKYSQSHLKIFIYYGRKKERDVLQGRSSKRPDQTESSISNTLISTLCCTINPQITSMSFHQHSYQSATALENMC